MNNGLSNDEIIAIISAELAKRGYTLTETLGKGKNRSSIEAIYRTESGMIDKRVVKIPTVEMDSNSIGHLYFLSKEQDPNVNEVQTSNDLRHENIARILDSYVFDIKGKKYVVNVEEHFDAASLEDVVNQWGPIRSREHLEGIFSQALAGASHASHQGVLHRDYKPSNILVNSEDKVKITDWQNAKNKDDIVKKTFPTRGGTPYTHPDLLNALITKKESCASDKTEIYAIATSFYFALTGKNPFNYNLVEDPAGIPIEVGGRVLRPVLKESGKTISEIDSDRHESNLKEALAKVPKKYKKWLYQGLTLTDTGYYKLDAFKADFEKIMGSKKEHFMKSLAKGAKNAGLVALGSAIIIGGGILIKRTPPGQSDIPTAMEIYQNTDYSNTDFEFMSDIDKHKSAMLLEDVLRGAEQKLEKIKQEKPKEYNKIMNKIQNWDDLRGHNKRLASSLVRACELTGSYQVQEIYNQGRTGGRIGMFAFPFQIVYQMDHDSWGARSVEFLPDTRQARYALEYLKRCVGTHTNPSDIYANYFSEATDIMRARKEAGNNSYFPTTVKDIPIRSLLTTGDHIKPGYSSYLPAGQRKLIDLALALYTITDKEGNVDFTKRFK